MKYPREIYQPSVRPYRGLSELEYPFHDRTITVTTCGRICIGKRKINLSIGFTGQNVGVKGQRQNLAGHLDEIRYRLFRSRYWEGH